jgi:acylphosphatase
MAANASRDVVVHGRVQGVFFRDTCRRRAHEVGVAGWVSNEPDGTVKAHFEGPADAVETMVDWARTGPGGADVAHVDVSDVAAEGLTSFEVR